MMQRVRRSLERRRGDDSGFTLVELVVAMVVTLVVMTALLAFVVQSLRTVALAKQRQTSTALATQVLERLRALPYDTVTAGTGSSAPTTDPNIIGTSPLLFRPAVIAGVEEELVVNAVSPLHTSESVEDVDYQVRQYVTKQLAAAGEQQAFNLTVIVQWTSSVSGGTRTTVERSTTYSPTGCLSTANRPFSGPCQASFTAQAGQSAASISVTHATDSTLPILGFDGREVELALPTLGANLLQEQTTSATATVATSEGSATDDTVRTSGGLSATVAVDSDPSSPPGQQQSRSTPTQTYETRSVNGIAGRLRVTPTTDDTGASAAAVAAEPALCLGADGAQIVTGVPERRPCATGRIRAAGSAGGIQYELVDVLGLASVSTPVASVAASPYDARAVAAHVAAASTTACTSGGGASGAGCAHAAARRALGDVVLGGLPSFEQGDGVSTTRPQGYTGAWKVTGLTETALAESGTGARPASYTRSGTLTWWNGTGYSQVALDSEQRHEISPAPLTVLFTTDTQVLEITVESSVTVEPATVSTAAPTGCATSACTATARAAGGIRGLTTYTVTLDGVVQTRFVVITQLGGLVTQASYKAAPDA
jgi:prepilin-type N-terminal cleavage/methylation domain-containing protein